MSERCKAVCACSSPQEAAPHFEFNRTLTAAHMALLLGLGGASMSVAAAQPVEPVETLEETQQGSDIATLELSETMVEGSMNPPGWLGRRQHQPATQVRRYRTADACDHHLPV